MIDYSVMSVEYWYYIYVQCGYSCSSYNIKCEALVTKRRDSSQQVSCSARPLSYVCDLNNLCSVCNVSIYWSIFTVIVLFVNPTCFFFFVWIFHLHFVFYKNVHSFIILWSQYSQLIHYMPLLLLYLPIYDERIMCCSSLENLM